MSDITLPSIDSLVYQLERSQTGATVHKHQTMIYKLQIVKKWYDLDKDNIPPLVQEEYDKIMSYCNKVQQ